MNKKRFVNIIAIVFIVILAGAAGFFVLKQQTQSPTQESSTAQPQPKTGNDISQQIDTSKETSPNNNQQTPPKKQTETPKPVQNTQNNLKFTVLYPPTPSSFGCNPYAGTYETQQGKVIQSYDQWKVLYDELLKNCYTKTDAPQIIDFNKQTMIAVFGGRSCTATNVGVKTVSSLNNKLDVHNVVTVGGCALPSFSFPFTLIAIDKSNLPIEFTFESAKNSNEPF